MRAVAYASAYWAMTKNEDEEKVRQYQRNIGVLMASTLERSVIITNLSRKATQQHLIDFFTFCGGIESLVIEEGSPFNTAIVVFDSVSAAKTASVVSSALIVDAPIRVQLRSASKAVIGDSSDVPAASKTYSAAEPSVSEVKPGFLARSIGAAYCAWKTLDFKYGVSEKAKSTASSVKSKFDSFDQENHITATIKDKLDAVDSKFGISAKSQNAARIVDSKLNEVKETAPIQSATSTVKQGVQQLTSVIGVLARLLITVSSSFFSQIK
jgi:RNA recognition motif-containing protein